MKTSCECCALGPEGMGALLMRLSLGMLFLVASLGKFMAPGGIGGFAQKMQESFANTWIPAFLVAPYVHALPFLEITVGFLLLLGLCTRWAFFLTGLLLISLAFGMMVQQQPAVVGTNLTYVLMAVAGIWLSARDNPLSVDGVIGRCREKMLNLK
jgi:thiosulfate dehydrogenase [quinone] large subunit